MLLAVSSQKLLRETKKYCTEWNVLIQDLENPHVTKN